jgi:hypothetical protein
VVSSAPAAPARQRITVSAKGLKIVMVPKYDTYQKTVCSTEYKAKTRYRTVNVPRTIPITEEKISTSTVMNTVQETKTIEYTSLVPAKTEKTVEVIVSVPVWSETTEEYMVKVPVLTDVEETYTVKVP